MWSVWKSYSIFFVSCSMCSRFRLNTCLIVAFFRFTAIHSLVQSFIFNINFIVLLLLLFWWCSCCSSSHFYDYSLFCCFFFVVFFLGAFNRHHYSSLSCIVSSEATNACMYSRYTVGTAPIPYHRSTTHDITYLFLSLKSLFLLSIVFLVLLLILLFFSVVISLLVLFLHIC